MPAPLKINSKGDGNNNNMEKMAIQFANIVVELAVLFPDEEETIVQTAEYYFLEYFSKYIGAILRVFLNPYTQPQEKLQEPSPLHLKIILYLAINFHPSGLNGSIWSEIVFRFLQLFPKNQEVFKKITTYTKENFNSHTWFSVMLGILELLSPISAHTPLEDTILELVKYFLEEKFPPMSFPIRSASPIVPEQACGKVIAMCAYRFSDRKIYQKVSHRALKTFTKNWVHVLEGAYSMLDSSQTMTVPLCCFLTNATIYKKKQILSKWVIPFYIACVSGPIGVQKMMSFMSSTLGDSFNTHFLACVTYIIKKHNNTVFLSTLKAKCIPTLKNIITIITNYLAQPIPPQNFARNLKAFCSCQCCRLVKNFLVDPVQKVFTFTSVTFQNCKCHKYFTHLHNKLTYYCKDVPELLRGDMTLTKTLTLEETKREEMEKDRVIALNLVKQLE